MMIHATTLPGQSSVKMEPSTDFKAPSNATKGEKGDDDVQHFKHLVNAMSSQVNMLEHKVEEVERFYSSNKKKLSMISKNKDKGRLVISIKRQLQQDHKAPSESMQELIFQFGKILNQIIQRKGTRSSQDSVDDDLGLHNCSELNGKPRDFSSIKRRMEIKDGTGYNHVREIYSDVRSVLKNAMKYNDERSDEHITANTLLAKFEEKWLLLLPKVMQEDERMEDDHDVQLADHARIARDISGELRDIEEHLNEVKEQVLQKCRKISTLEKREIGRALTQLSAEDLRQALEIVAQSNPAFQASAEEVDLDIDAQSEYTLRRLKYFIMDVYQAREKPVHSVGRDNTDNNEDANTDKAHNSNFKRKREIIDVSGKTAKKKIKTHG
ncbi:transcription factor GTE1-like isoform X2 [Silene latifolia]|uniref:transcription factor GTE1-like isoform X2 n=1 Tax=Silene latifolia TaxID=37657 RepID=UPI003D76FB7B